MSQNCGLILLLEKDHNFSPAFLDRLSCLHKVIFPLFNIPQSTFVNVILCDKKKIQELNNRFKKKNKATDVLSWLYGESIHSIGKTPFGEVVICTEICHLQAEQNDWSFEIEFMRLLIHALAHLGGYDHTTVKQERKMLAKEKEALKLCQLDFIY